MAFHGAYICVSMSTCCIQNSNHCNNLQGERGLKWPLNSIIVTTHKHADMVALINIPGHLYHTLSVCGLLITFPDLTLTNTMRSRILFRLFCGFSVFHYTKFLSVRRQWFPRWFPTHTEPGTNGGLYSTPRYVHTGSFHLDPKIFGSTRVSSSNSLSTL